MKRLVALLFSLLLLNPNAFAQEEEPKHRIDIWLEAACVKDSSTAGMVQATAKALEMWDAELNSVYKQLMTALSKPQAALLKDSQRKWLELRDAEFEFQTNFYGSFEGTMWRVAAVSQRMEVVRSRVLQLKGYLDAMTEQ